MIWNKQIKGKINKHCYEFEFFDRCFYLVLIFLYFYTIPFINSCKLYIDVYRYIRQLTCLHINSQIFFSS